MSTRAPVTFDVSPVWKQVTPQLKDEVLAFWKQNRAIGDPDRAQQRADEVVCIRTPDPFVAVGLWYHDFTPTSDREVRSLLET